ncbi:hypothetical protein TRIUR3_16167 [Triticum urartu]|uniref:Rx N-terminal domain-containing protein n=2 Tax=Triticum urartu TaxID=4572 RepID=M8A6P1_TRIUA|nr:uncharacterized protein LOC125535036 [Triticum urartu]EMS56074.1 hypothetical protein TRIUR3_16167 [Triticum urartu]
MEVALSAVAGELVSRFISFLLNKYHSSRPHSQEKVMERLQHLLVRVCTIVEEADTRYITNSGMMMQLNMLSEAMYRGYSVVDNSKYQALQDGASSDEVSSNDSSIGSLYLAKRSQTSNKGTHLELHCALESLEIVVANMAEFVILLGGCERMSRRPYDVYLYIDNFMFGRHAEKQKLLSFLLQHDDPLGDHALAVLPLIGGATIGKKTLVAHVCGDERVRLRFSSILHLNGDNLLRILDHGRTMKGMMLIVIEFVSDVNDNDWKKFHSFLIRIGRGSKIIIVSRIKRLARFGSVKPIFLSALSHDELRYLFKIMAFGSVDPTEHPRLLQLADEFAKVLHSMQSSLVEITVFADALRRSLHVQSWCCILDKGIRFLKRNLSMYGMPPRIALQEQGHPVDITDVTSHPHSMTPYTMNASIEKPPRVTSAELLTDPSVRPKGDFILILWESRIPPHESFEYFVTSRVQDTHQGSTLAGRKRRGGPV